MLCVLVGSLPLVWVFDHLGRFDLARPALYSIAMLAIAIKWKLRRHVWFWITLVVIVALILFVPWTTKTRRRDYSYRHRRFVRNARDSFGCREIRGKAEKL